MTSEEGSPTRFMALDYGLSRIGVAVSDELGLMAHPRPFVPAKPPARAIRIIQGLVTENEVSELLVGLPLNMDGTEGLSARRVRKFVQELESKVGLAVRLVDERWSTVSAQARLHEAGRRTKDSRAHIDSASAAVVLQSFLDGRRSDA